MQDLIDKTHAVHYELYRRTKLEDMGFSDGRGDKQPHSLQETYELRRQEYMKNIQGREEQMRQSFVNKVKEKEAELKQAEQEVRDGDFRERLRKRYLFCRKTDSKTLEECRLPGVSLRARHQANWPAVRMILPNRFDHLEERFSDREPQFKKFCPPVKSSCPPAEIGNKTPVHCDRLRSQTHTLSIKTVVSSNFSGYVDIIYPFRNKITESQPVCANKYWSF